MAQGRPKRELQVLGLRRHGANATTATRTGPNLAGGPRIAPRKDARAGSRSAAARPATRTGASRKPALAAGTKAGNSKRFGFTARPKQGTKKRG
jgi:hypothetical protein